MTETTASQPALVALRLWNDRAAKQAIMDFVGRVTEDAGPDYVEPAARVAVFDNDGTLWTEKPLVIQLDFTIRRFGEMAKMIRHYERSSRTRPRTSRICTDGCGDG